MSVPHYLQDAFAHLGPHLFSIVRHYELHGRGHLLVRLVEDTLAATPDHDTAVRLSAALAAIIWKRGQHEEASQRLLLAIEYGRDQVQDPYLMSDALYWLGDIQYVQATLIGGVDLSAAWQNHQQALSIRERVNDDAAVALSLSRLGTLYERERDMDTAIEYHRRAIEVSERIDYTRGMTRPLMQLGGFFRQRDDIERALPYYTKALRLSREIDDQEGVAFALIDVARAVYDREQNFKKAVAHLTQALEIASDSDFVLLECRTLQVMATIYAQAGRGPEAVLTLQRVIEIAAPVGYRVFVDGARRQLALLSQ